MDPFRIISIVLFFCLIAIGSYHRARADRANLREKLSRKDEGWFILIALRLLGLASWLGLILYMINPDILSWSFVTIPVWLRWAGAMLVAINVLLMFWMFSSLGNNVTDTVVTRKEHQLVTTGPYRYVRHPMYCIVFVLFTGFMLLTTSWFIGITGLAAFFLLMMRTPIEEKNLVKRFGKAYEDYMARTNRFIPTIRL